MSVGLGGLIVAQMIAEDWERNMDDRRARRAERSAMKASRAPRWASLSRRGRREGPVGRSNIPAFPES